MKLKPNFVGFGALAGQPCPFECVFAFLDVLLGGSAPVVELKHPFLWNRQRRDHKTYARKQLAEIPFHLGKDPARFTPTPGLIGRVGI